LNITGPLVSAVPFASPGFQPESPKSSATGPEGDEVGSRTRILARHTQRAAVRAMIASEGEMLHAELRLSLDGRHESPCRPGISVVRKYNPGSPCPRRHGSGRPTQAPKATGCCFDGQEIRRARPRPGASAARGRATGPSWFRVEVGVETLHTGVQLNRLPSQHRLESLERGGCGWCAVFQSTGGSPDDHLEHIPTMRTLIYRDAIRWALLMFCAWFRVDETLHHDGLNRLSAISIGQTALVQMSCGQTR